MKRGGNGSRKRIRQAAHWCNLGAAYQERGNPDAALEAYRHGSGLDSSRWEVYLNAAILLQTQNDWVGAEKFYSEAIQRKTDCAPAWAGLAQSYARMHKFEDSAYCFREALKFHPAAELYCDLAQILILCGRLDGAFDAARKALALKPGLALAHCHRGTILRRRGSLLDAKRAFEAALACDPQCSEAMQKLGNVASQLCLWDDAVAWFVRALELNPGAAEVHSSLLFTLTISGALPPERLFEEHQRWAEMHKPQAPGLLQESVLRDPSRKLRIGFVSGDFRDHPIRFFIAPILRHLDRSEFDVFCYSNCATPDSSTRQLRALAAEWREVSRDTDSELCARIRQDRIDILVDLSGHTTAHRLLVFQNKPAPVQVTYLGYPNTTGLTSIDYWITDRVLHPADTRHRTSEQICRLPRCWVIYEPPPDAPEITERDATGPLTFVSFNALQKLSADSICLWGRVLATLPESVLLVKAGALGGSEEQNFLRNRFAMFGVAPDRVTLMGQVPSIREHLASYGQADIALDTTPFSGGTTTAEALWMGVPVVTMAGDLMISRMSASMLNAVGLDELIAASENEFVRIASELAHNAERRRQLRRDLRKRVAASPLCDGPGLASAIGIAFRQMWTSWCADSGQETLE